jgi:hypothetical protein
MNSEILLDREAQSRDGRKNLIRQIDYNVRELTNKLSQTQTRQNMYHTKQNATAQTYSVS